ILCDALSGYGGPPPAPAAADGRLDPTLLYDGVGLPCGSSPPPPPPTRPYNPGLCGADPPALGSRCWPAGGGGGPCDDGVRFSFCPVPELTLPVGVVYAYGAGVRFCSASRSFATRGSSTSESRGPGLRGAPLGVDARLLPRSRSSPRRRLLV